MGTDLRNIKLKDINIHVKDEVYDVKESLGNYKEEEREKFLEQVKNDRYFNGVLNRVKEVRKTGKGYSIEVEDVMYDDFIKTNEYFKENVKGTGGEEERYYKDNRLNLANTIGTSGLIITLDGSYIIQKRSGNVTVSKGELIPSYAGGVTGLKEGTVEDNLDVFVYKELEEELGIKSHELEKIQLINMYTNKDYLGGLEFNFYIVLNLTDEDVKERFKNTKDRWESAGLYFVKNLKELNEERFKEEKLSVNLRKIMEVTNL